MTEPRFVRELLPTIPQAVLDGFGRTGAAVPPALEGCTVLDLGCKTGREAFLAARLVGETGRVISIDASADAQTIDNVIDLFVTENLSGE